MRLRVLAVGALLGLACADGAGDAGRPNVVLITLDTTRADRLGSYGSRAGLTPHLDALALEGTVFSNAIAQAAVTPVSHASILTGLNPYRHGLRVMHGLDDVRLADEHLTVAEMLQAAGYRTAAFVSAFPVSERFGLHQGFEVFDADFLEQPESEIVTRDGRVNTRRNQRHAGETTSRALAWLAGTREPFFLWVHYFDPHDPVVLPPRDRLRAWEAKWGEFADEREHLRAVYDAEVAYMDAEIGRLLAGFDGRGDSAVVVVADHGEGLGDHDWWTHGVLYQEQIRVPLIVAAPSLPGGGRVEALVRTVDIVPTLAELVGLAPHERPNGDGTSLVAWMTGERSDPAGIAYSDSVNRLTYRLLPNLEDHKDDILLAVVEGPWKYIHHVLRPQESELYQLEQDPGELRNQLGERPEVAARLRARLDSLEPLPEAARVAGPADPELVERLRALGYVAEEDAP